MTRDIVYALQQDPGGHIVIAHIPGYVLDDELAIYHYDWHWRPYWWVIDRKTGLGIKRVDTLAEVKKLIDDGFWKRYYERILKKMVGKKRISYDKNALRMRNHLNNIREDSGIIVMSNRSDCGHKVYKEVLR